MAGSGRVSGAPAIAVDFLEAGAGPLVVLLHSSV
jgi:hypothetical protein